MSAIPLLRTRLRTLLKSVHEASHPLAKDYLDSAVAEILEQTQSRSGKDAEWECVCRREMLLLTMKESNTVEDNPPGYYQDLRDLLDVVLTIGEAKACDPALPVWLLEDAFETQTVPSCMVLFSWLEERTVRVTSEMEPSKMKGLSLLRSLNSLLRRTSKTGDSTQFCGRIIIFMSSVFPFGERSGVNLRGEYGLAWEPVQIVAQPASEEKMEDVEPISPDIKKEASSQPDAPVAPASEETEDEKTLFYNTFWSLQAYFARPHLFSSKEAISTFKAATATVMGTLMEVSKKEQGSSGSTAKSAGPSSGAKRKQIDPQHQIASDEPQNVGQDYFFAKFLTSPDLLDFELSDPLFRRQILLQLLILLRNLLSWTPREKANWSTKTPSLQLDITLDDADEKWIRETYGKAMAEIRITGPDSKTFANTILVILEREQNWVRWKNDVCPPMDRTATRARQLEAERVAGKTEEELQEEERELWNAAFKRLVPTTEIEDPDPPQPYGSEDLEEAWSSGVRGLADLEDPEEPNTLQGITRQMQLQDARKEMLRKRKGLPPRASSNSIKPSRSSTPLPAPRAVVPSSDANGMDVDQPKLDPKTVASLAPPTSASPAPVHRGVMPLFELIPQEEDTDLREFDLHKQSLNWLGLRLAIRQGHFHHFYKIPRSDIALLLPEIQNAPPAVLPSETNTMEIDDVKEGAIEDTEGVTENDDPLDGEDEALSPPKELVPPTTVEPRVSDTVMAID